MMGQPTTATENMSQTRLLLILSLLCAGIGVFSLIGVAVGVTGALTLEGERTAVMNEVARVRGDLSTIRLAQDSEREKLEIVRGDAAKAAENLLNSQNALGQIAPKLIEANSSIAEAERLRQEIATNRGLAESLRVQQAELKSANADLVTLKQQRDAVAKSVSEQTEALLVAADKVKQLNPTLTQAEVAIQRAKDAKTLLTATEDELKQFREQVDSARIDLQTTTSKLQVVQKDLADSVARVKVGQDLDKEIREKSRQVGELDSIIKSVSADQAEVVRLRVERDGVQKDVDVLQSEKRKIEQSIKTVSDSEKLAAQLEVTFNKLLTSLQRVADKLEPQSRTAPVDPPKDNAK